MPAQVAAAFDVVDTKLGPVSFALACAGTADVLEPAWRVDPELWWQAVAVDLLGTMLIARAALARLRTQQAGRLEY